MDFSPHTPEDVTAMLEVLGLAGVDDLFEAIPESLRAKGDLDLPAALSEPELKEHLAGLAKRSSGRDQLICFAGGGAYDHHVPSAVKALAGRAEFATSYTPYQAELSQGILQALYEFQTLVCALYGMEVANASLYDGANALVEAVTLSVRTTKRNKVAVASTIHPHFLDVLHTYTTGIDLVIDRLPYDEGGLISWTTADVEDCAAVVLASPNVFGGLEDVRAACARAHEAGALAVVSADPAAMGILEAPGNLGADVVVGEGGALAGPPSYGGPYVGLFATTERLLRQVPGRISGETLDADGRRAYVLTLQAREQHIRRAKATSNVCTNQTLLAVATAIHLAWLGPCGLERLGELCARRTALAARRLGAIDGCSIRFDGPRFKELVLETPMNGRRLARRLADRGFLAGPGLGDWFPELDRCVLVAVTEQRTSEDISSFAEAIEKELAET